MLSQRLLDNVTDAGGSDQQRHLVESRTHAQYKTVGLNFHSIRITYMARGV